MEAVCKKGIEELVVFTWHLGETLTERSKFRTDSVSLDDSLTHKGRFKSKEPLIIEILAINKQCVMSHNEEVKGKCLTFTKQCKRTVKQLHLILN